MSNQKYPDSLENMKNRESTIYSLTLDIATSQDAAINAKLIIRLESLLAKHTTREIKRGRPINGQGNKQGIALDESTN